MSVRADFRGGFRGDQRFETRADQRVDQLVQHGLAALDVEQHVVGLDQVLDRVRQLAAAPVLETVDLALAALDQALVALDHGRHLLALVRVDQEHDFVMTHGVFLVDIGP